MIFPRHVGSKFTDRILPPEKELRGDGTAFEQKMLQGPHAEW